MSGLVTLIHNTANAHIITPQEDWAVVVITAKDYRLPRQFKKTSQIKIAFPNSVSTGQGDAAFDGQATYSVADRIRSFLTASVARGATTIVCIGDDLQIVSAIARYTQVSYHSRVTQDTTFCNTLVYKTLCDKSYRLPQASQQQSHLKSARA